MSGSTTSGTGAAGTGGAVATASSTRAAASSTGGAAGSGGAAGLGGAACVPVDDHDPCTDDVCQGGVPVHVPQSDTPCPSGDPCVVGNICQAGVCVGGGPLTCYGGFTCYAGACVAQATVAAADFDGDGKQDLVVAGSETDSVAVLFGLGNGKFAAPVGFPAGLAPSNVVAADLDGDGKPDLVVPNGVGGTVSVLMNLGGGAFAPPVGYAAVTAPGSIAVADFDGDGKADIAVAEEHGNTIGLLLGQGGGAFGAPVINVKAGADLVVIAAADFDGDGKPDLAFTHNISVIMGGVSVLWNKGGGVFSAPAVVGHGVYSSAIQVADFDSNGKPDIAVAFGSDEGNGIVSVYLNQGQRVFSSAAGFVGGYEDGGFLFGDVLGLSTGDFDGDGKPDLACIQPSDPSGAVSVLLNQGGGAFAFAGTTPVDGSPSSIATADLDGDGKPNVAVAVPTDTVDVLSNLGGGALSAPVGHDTSM